MQTVKFYNTSNPNVNYYSILLSSPETVYKDTLKIYAMRESYKYSPSHSLSTIKNGSIVNSDLSIKFNSINYNSIGYNVISADDIIFGNTSDKVGQNITGFVIAGKTNAIMFLDNLDDLPMLITGRDIILNFSKGINKFIRYNANDVVMGSIIISTQAAKDIMPSYSKSVRSSKSVTYDEITDKNIPIGKNGIYKDISISGKAHPLTGDLVSLQGDAAISQSLKNILLANAFERPFSSQQTAGNLNSFLFEFNDDISYMELKSGISIAINNNEPRVTVVDILVNGDPHSYAVEVQLIYIIKTTNITQSFSIMIERA